MSIGKPLCVAPWGQSHSPRFRQDFAVPSFGTGTQEAAAEGKDRAYSAPGMLIFGPRGCCGERGGSTTEAQYHTTSSARALLLSPKRQKTSNYNVHKVKLKSSQLVIHRETTKRENKEEHFAVSKAAGCFVFFTRQGFIFGLQVKAHVEMGLRVGPRIPPNPAFCLKSAGNCFSIFLLRFHVELLQPRKGV